MTFSAFTPPTYYKYTRLIRVDPDGQGDYTTVPDALAAAAAHTPRGFDNRILVQVRDGIYFGGPYDVPSWTTVECNSNAQNFSNGYGATFYYSFTNPIPASWTYFWNCDTGAVLSNIGIFQSSFPANFNAEFAMVRFNGYGDLLNSVVIQTGTYTGANRLYTVYKPNNGQFGVITLSNSWLNAAGSGATTVRVAHSSSVLGAYQCQFHGNPLYHFELNHTASSAVSTLMNCRTISDTGQLSSNGRPTSAIMRTSGANTRVRLFNTFVPLNERSNGGNFEEVAPTPQQLQTSVRATSRTVALDTTLNGYTDGTVVRTAGNLTMPPSLEVISGQSFVLVNDGANTMNVSGNGNNIEGSASITVSVNKREIIQWSGTEWFVVGSNTTATLDFEEVSWAFSTPVGSSGTFYAGGSYSLFSGNDDFSPSITFGVVNNPYAAHFFIVLGAAPSDTLTIRVTGTSITDGGTRTVADTEDIVVDTGDATDDYFETSKRWLGQVAVEAVSGTPIQCNYGYSKYYHNGNSDFTIRAWEATWVGGANDAGADIEVIHHKDTGWTYNAGSAPSPPAAIGSMASDYVTENDVTNNEYGAWKRTGLSQLVLGSGNEGVILRITTTANRTFEEANFLLELTG